MNERVVFPYIMKSIMVFQKGGCPISRLKKWRESATSRRVIGILERSACPSRMLSSQPQILFNADARKKLTCAHECVESSTATNPKRKEKTCDRSQVCSRDEVSDGVLLCLLMSNCVDEKASTMATEPLCIVSLARPRFGLGCRRAIRLCHCCYNVMVVIDGRVLLNRPPLLHSIV